MTESFHSFTKSIRIRAYVWTTVCKLTWPNFLARTVPGSRLVEFSALLGIGMHFADFHSWFSCSPVNHMMVSATCSPDSVFYITFPARGWRADARESVLSAHHLGGSLQLSCSPPHAKQAENLAPSLGATQNSPPIPLTNNHRPNSLPENYSILANSFIPT